jgi:polysaccharide export outer membrane protein
MATGLLNSTSERGPAAMNWKTLNRVAGLAIISLVTATAPGISQPISPAPASGEYSIGPEDVVQVWVWKEPDLSTTAMVRPDGKISLPLIGELEAKGKTALQLQQEVSKGLTVYLSEPVVTVIVKEVNYPKISVLGQVRKPDVYKIRQNMTVLDAIALAGGFTDYANRGKVTVLRNTSPAPQEYKLDLKHPDRNTVQFYLQPFDTVYVD